MSFSSCSLVRIFVGKKMIRLNFYRNVALSSSLPTSLNIDQCTEGYAVVSVIVNGKVIYSATLYADDDNMVYLNDFRKIVEDYMAANGLNRITLSVDADMGLGLDYLDPSLTVVYSKIRTSYEMDCDFLDSHFLTNSYGAFFNAEGSFTLYFYRSSGDESADGFVALTARDREGNMSALSFPFSFSSAAAGFYYKHIDLPVLQSFINENAPGFLLTGGTVHIAKRSFSFFISAQKPSYTFDFLNAFNCWERMPLFGSTTLKTEFSAKEGICNGITSFYNRETSRKFEVTTRAMSLTEARAFNEFLASNRIYFIIPPDQDYDILISDVTSEITDDATEKIRIKFSWRFTDNTDWRIFSDSPEVFNSNFTDVFT